MLDRIHHVGVACREIETVRRWVHSSHQVLTDSGIVFDPIQDAEVCLLAIAGGAAIELVSGGAVENLVKRGQSYYHLCYEVPSIDDAIEALVESGCMRVSGPVPAVLFDGRPVAFLLGPTGLVELLEI